MWNEHTIPFFGHWKIEKFQLCVVFSDCYCKCTFSQKDRKNMVIKYGNLVHVKRNYSGVGFLKLKIWNRSGNHSLAEWHRWHWTFVFPIWFKKESIDKCIKYHSGLILSSHFVGSKIKIHDQLMIRLASQASLSNVFLIYDSLQRLGSL